MGADIAATGKTARAADDASGLADSIVKADKYATDAPTVKAATAIEAAAIPAELRMTADIIDKKSLPPDAPAREAAEQRMSDIPKYGMGMGYDVLSGLIGTGTGSLAGEGAHAISGCRPSRASQPRCWNTARRVPRVPARTRVYLRMIGGSAWPSALTKARAAQTGPGSSGGIAPQAPASMPQAGSAPPPTAGATPPMSNPAYAERPRLADRLGELSRMLATAPYSSSVAPARRAAQSIVTSCSREQERTLRARSRRR